MLGTCDVPEKELAAFDNEYLEQFGAVGMQAATIAEPKKFELTTENVTIQVDPTRTDLVETRRIDGKRYILIAVEGEAAVKSAQDAVKRLRESGVRVGAVFHGNTSHLENIHRIYGHAYVRIQKANQLAQGVSDLLLMLLREMRMD